LDNSSAPFRAYFKANMSNSPKICLSIGNGGETTSLSEELRVKSEEFATAAEWYTLDGRRLKGKPTTKGLYIVNGQRVIVK
jgi:hypothetical protein